MTVDGLTTLAQIAPAHFCSATHRCRSYNHNSAFFQLRATQLLKGRSLPRLDDLEVQCDTRFDAGDFETTFAQCRYSPALLCARKSLTRCRQEFPLAVPNCEIRLKRSAKS